MCGSWQCCTVLAGKMLNILDISSHMSLLFINPTSLTSFSPRGNLGASEASKDIY